MVEVRGVEPRSVEPSALASPSAVVSELSSKGTLTTSLPLSSRSCLDRPIPALRAEHPALRRPNPIGREPIGRTGCYLGSQCEVIFGTYWLFRFVNEAPETSARFQRLNTQRRNRFTPKGYHQSTWWERVSRK